MLAHVVAKAGDSKSRKGSGARDKRNAPRHLLYIPVAVEFGSTCAEGRLCDISVSGGRIEQAHVKPALQSQVTITFAFSLAEPAFEVIGRVIRHTGEGGFAVQFEAIDPKLKSAVERAASALKKLPDTPIDGLL
jgi:hypothetical protein